MPIGHASCGTQQPQPFEHLNQTVQEESLAYPTGEDVPALSTAMGGARYLGRYPPPPPCYLPPLATSPGGWGAGHFGLLGVFEESGRA